MELLQGLYKSHPQLPHALMLYRCRKEMGERSAAKEQLQLAYRRFSDGPKHVRQRYCQAAQETRVILRDAEELRAAP